MENSESIVLGGGCFWCTEAALKLVPGVIRVEPGYAGGTKDNPTYEEICSGKTGHAEVIKVTFDPKKVTLGGLLEIFFHAHDPTTKDRQGNDRGNEYRSIILFDGKEQEKSAKEAVKRAQKDWKEPIVTQVEKLGKFWPSEDYHKNYYKKNPLQPYCLLVVRPKVEKIREYLAKE